MKKIFMLLGVTVISFMLISCSSEDETETNGEEADAESQENKIDSETAESDERNGNNQEGGDGDSAGDDQTEQISTANQGDEKEYYKELAVLGGHDELDPDVLENLELRGIHENTLIYNGTVNPKYNVRFEFPQREGQNARDTIDPEVSEEGNFSISFSGQEFDTDDEIRFYISDGGLPHEQAFDLPVHAAEDGMEVIESNACTTSQEEAVLEEVTLPDIYPDTRIYDPATADIVDNVHYSIDGEIFRHDLLMKSADDQNPEGNIFTVFDENPEAGQIFEFYIVADGVTAKIEKEVKELSEDEQQAVDAIIEETELPEIYTDTTSYEGKTNSNADVTATNADQTSWKADLNIDEDGNFTLPLEDHIEEAGETILFVITGENGVSTTIEREVMEE